MNTDKTSMAAEEDMGNSFNKKLALQYKTSGFSVQRVQERCRRRSLVFSLRFISFLKRIYLILRPGKFRTGLT